MANTLTGILPTLYEALNVVSREMVGFIPAVRRNTGAERAGLNQTVRVPIAEAGALETITPAAAPAATGDTTVGYADVTISNSKAAPVRWSGEEERAVGTGGTFNRILADQFTDAMPKLLNAVEVDLAATAKVSASRAFGTAGTAPFNTAGSLTHAAGVRKILEDNGAPTTDLQLVLNSAAMANLRGVQSVLFKVNEAGSSDMLRNGLTDRLMGFALRNSAGLVAHTRGTADTAYDVNLLAGYAVGASSIAVDTGAGTILAGDIVSFAGDTNLYVVKTALSGGSIVIQAPGLRQTLADGVDVTVGAAYTPNIAFARNALVLVSRAPAIPTGGDSADDAMILTDPVSGLSFEVRMYRQYRQVKYEVCLAWDVAAVKPEHIALLLG